MLPGDSFDERLLRWIDGHRLDALDSVTTQVMDVSELKWFWAVVGLIGLALVIYTKAWRVGLAVGAAGYLGAFASGLLKSEFARVRPTYSEGALAQVGSSYAMPSSHAALMMAAAIALLAVVGWRSRRSLVLATTCLGLGLLLIGAMMVYLGAHWATDVLAGWVLGMLIGVVVGLLFRPRERLV